jgi:hypothetical protein
VRLSPSNEKGAASNPAGSCIVYRRERLHEWATCRRRKALLATGTDLLRIQRVTVLRYDLERVPVEDDAGELYGLGLKGAQNVMYKSSGA